MRRCLHTRFDERILLGPRAESALIFKPAYVVSATDIPDPIQSIAIGTVVLEVVVSETGKVDSVLPIREIDSLAEVAIDSGEELEVSRG